MNPAKKSNLWISAGADNNNSRNEVHYFFGSISVRLLQKTFSRKNWKLFAQSLPRWLWVIIKFCNFLLVSPEAWSITSMKDIILTFSGTIWSCQKIRNEFQSHPHQASASCSWCSPSVKNQGSLSHALPFHINIPQGGNSILTIKRIHIWKCLFC